MVIDIIKLHISDFTILLFCLKRKETEITHVTTLFGVNNIVKLRSIVLMSTTIRVLAVTLNSSSTSFNQKQSWQFSIAVA